MPLHDELLKRQGFAPPETQSNRATTSRGVLTRTPTLASATTFQISSTASSIVIPTPTPTPSSRDEGESKRPTYVVVCTSKKSRLIDILIIMPGNCSNYSGILRSLLLLSHNSPDSSETQESQIYTYRISEETMERLGTCGALAITTEQRSLRTNNDIGCETSRTECASGNLQCGEYSKKC